ncbi:hypothetical protein GOV03_01915 [Candidatus Woesearchaeota archaeon]|nr:hypothetical protein [Candidatus Woesearchaeota archaeon]
MVNPDELYVVDEDNIERDMDTLRQKLKEAYTKNPLITIGEAIDNLQNEFYRGSLESLSEEEIERNLVREIAIEELGLDKVPVRNQHVSDYLPSEYLKKD